jgi:hypothetical protein
MNKDIYMGSLLSIYAGSGKTREEAIQNLIDHTNQDRSNVIINHVSCVTGYLPRIKYIYKGRQYEKVINMKQSSNGWLAYI